MGSRTAAASKAPRAAAEATEARAAYRAGFLAGLAAAEDLRADALKIAAAELAEFKAGAPEFYAEVREQMAAFFDEEARTRPWPFSLRASAMAEVARRDIQPDERAVLGALTKARRRAHDKQTDDLVEIARVAAFVLAGGVNKEAPAKLGIGEVRMKRLRAKAVKQGILKRRR